MLLSACLTLINVVILDKTARIHPIKFHKKLNKQTLFKERLVVDILMCYCKRASSLRHFCATTLGFSTLAHGRTRNFPLIGWQRNDPPSSACDWLILIF